MKFLRWWFSSSLLFIYLGLYAQSGDFYYFTHERIVDTLYNGAYINNAAIGTVELPGSFVIAGVTVFQFNSCIYFEKINKQGELLNTITIGCEADSIYDVFSGTQLHYTSANEIVLAYYKGVYDDDIFQGDMGLLKMDTNLNIIANTTYPLPFSQEPYTSCLRSDGGFLLCGKDQSVLAGQVQPPKIMVLSLDASANLLWSRKYDFQPDNQTLPISILPTSDGNYLIGGDVQENFNSGQNFQHLILKIDEQGDTLWTKRWGEADFNCARIDINSIDEGSYFCSTTRESNLTGKELYRFKIDNNGIIYDEQISAYTYPIVGSKYLRLSQDRIVSIGGNYTDDFYYDFYFYILNNELDSIFSKRVGYEGGFSYVRKDFDRTSDGGFIITGFTLPVGNPSPQKGFVFKIDSLGNYCSAWGCDSVVLDTSSYISYLQEFQQGRHTISTAPNPCNDHFTLSYNLPQEAENCWFRLFDARGIERRSLRLSETIGSKEVQLSHCEAGIYYWKLVIGNRVIDTGKLVVR